MWFNKTILIIKIIKLVILLNFHIIFYFLQNFIKCIFNYIIWLRIKIYNILFILIFKFRKISIRNRGISWIIRVRVISKYFDLVKNANIFFFRVIYIYRYLGFHFVLTWYSFQDLLNVIIFFIFFSFYILILPHAF